MAIEFASKARTLQSLRNRLTTAVVLPQLSFSVYEWKNDRSAHINKVRPIIGNGPYIVRSSCQQEDTQHISNAGSFLSLLNIHSSNLESAVEQVISSYGNATADDEVLIQPMLQNVLRSGVAFSHDPNTCSAYRIINWQEGSDTTIVTSGMGGQTWQQAALSPYPPPEELSSVIALLEELLALFEEEPLDCEFAFTEDEEQRQQLWLLQVRPLVLLCQPEKASIQATRLLHIQDKVERGMQPHPFLMGRRTVYGVMPDWNPAEIIGIRPKPLALSLYRDLVTDAIWAYQRHNYGYRNLRSFPLMPHFFGLPYIDARLSFNSFIPADLDQGLAGRLVDHYIDRLLDEPSLHDKMEFEIVFSCYTLDLPKRLERLDEAGFTKSEQRIIAESLRKLTNRIVDTRAGLWRSDAAKLERLHGRRDELLNSRVGILERIYWLLEDAKRYGTLPFAGLARAGFIAVQMLRSLVEVGVFSQADYDAFFAGVTTVSGKLAVDRATLTRNEFLQQYGHLRPGTYDILSPRYDEAPDLYFDWNQKITKPEPVKPFSITLPQMRELVGLLKVHQLQPDPVGLFDFLQAGIEMRELAKFHFTRNLSDVLQLLTEYGGALGFSREDLAYCDIVAIKELHIAAADPADVLTRSIEMGKARYRESLALALPPVISKPEDVWAFGWPEMTANFITQKQATGLVVDYQKREKLEGAIVCIASADPGYDWLFSYPIAGLITAWGGVNSHMAIRAGEQGLPAVIGVGEALFRRWSGAQRLHLDCATRKVEVLA